MDEQNLPIHRGTVGFYDIRDLTLGSWQRMGRRETPQYGRDGRANLHSDALCA